VARKPRIHYPGAVYHVILRGNAGQRETERLRPTQGNAAGSLHSRLIFTLGYNNSIRICTSRFLVKSSGPKQLPRVAVFVSCGG
jgi:hypothetical protein